MGDDEEVVSLARIERSSVRGSIDRQPGSSEDEEIEVELPRAPALALMATERALELLEGDQERGRARRGIWTRGHVEGDGRVPEWRLIDDADRSRDVEPGDGPEADARQGRQRPDGAGKRAGRVAEVRPEPDVRPHSSHRPADLAR